MSTLIMITAVGAVFAYPLIATLVLRSAESARMEIADIGRRLLNDPAIGPGHKAFIADMLEDVFEWRFVAYAIFAFPAAVYRALTGRTVQLGPDEAAFLARPEVRRLFDLHIRATMASAPLLSVVFVIVASISTGVALCCVGASRFMSVWVDTVHTVTPKVGQHHQGAQFHAK